MIMDNFHLSGDKMDAFKKDNANMAECTKDLVVRGGDITFLSLCKQPAHQKSGKLAFHILHAEAIHRFLEGYPLQIGYIPIEKFGNADIIDEMAKTTNLCCSIDNKLYLISDIAIRTLTLRAEVKGDMTMQRNNLIRNMHIADAIFDKAEKIHLVYRTEVVDGVEINKIFAGLGNAYKLIPQTILTDSINRLSEAGTLGDIRMSSYEIDHEYSTVKVTMPSIGEEIAEEYKIDTDVVPGLYISTSDVGASSVVIRGLFWKGYSYVITDEVSIKHAGNITPERILAEADEKIFTNIRKLPEALSELIGTEAADYSKLDLSTESGQKKNKDAVQGIIKEEIRFACKEANISGKKKEQLLEGIYDEINPTITYTLYDIAINLMGIADRISGLDRDTLTRLHKACGRIPYRLLQRKSKKKHDDDIVLLPE